LDAAHRSGSLRERSDPFCGRHLESLKDLRAIDSSTESWHQVQIGVACVE